MDREVRAVAGFSWGFEMGDGDVSIVLPAALRPAAWEAQLPLLRTSRPGWTFSVGSE